MLRTAIWAALVSAAAALHAQDGEQRFASLGDFRLQSGETIRDCRIGYRTWGKLDAARSNAVLFPTWFSGTTAQLAANIGAGKVIDPASYYVIAVDAIGNGISTSPSNSAAQPRMKFPRFTIGDMVESQHQLVTGTLGLTHLRGVIGISMGGMQTFQWMVAYPEFLDRAVPISGNAAAHALRHAPLGGRAPRNRSRRQLEERRLRATSRGGHANRERHSQPGSLHASLLSRAESRQGHDLGSSRRREGHP